MKIVVEFSGYFRLKAGCEYYETEINEGSPVSELIISIERDFKSRELVILKDGKMKDGALLFVRNDGGGLKRIFDTAALIDETGRRFLLANLMGGG